MDERTRKVLHSSATDLWSTPQHVFDELSDRFGPFDLDVCAGPTNKKVPAYFGAYGVAAEPIAEDGLSQDWTNLGFLVVPRCWMNPPYGRVIGQWIQKASETALAGGYVVALLPSRTGTRWWHRYVEPVRLGQHAGEVHFVEGRLKFGDAKNCAPFDSAVVVFGRKP